MTKSARLTGLEAAEGDRSGHRPKRAKTVHNVEDEILGNLDRMLGAIPFQQASGTPAPLTIRGVASNGYTASELAQSPTTMVSIDFKVVPRDPSLQALWVAREIKRFAVHNQGHMDRSTLGSETTASPVSPTFAMGPQSLVNGNQNGTPNTSMNNSRSSGRKRRQTSKAKDLYFADIGIEDDPPTLNEHGELTSDGQRMLAALLGDWQIQDALLTSDIYGPGNFAKRQLVGILFMESMAAIIIPPDPHPAAKLKEALWRSRNNTTFINALQILAGFDKVVQAIDVAFHGRLDPSTPLTYAVPRPRIDNQPDGDVRLQPQLNGDVRSRGGDVRREVVVRPKRKIRPYGVKIQKRIPAMKSPALVSPKFFPGLVSGNPAGFDLSLQADDEQSFETSFETAEAVSESEGPPTPEPTRPELYTPVDPVQSARAVIALKGATAVLDDMAYGALKFYFMPHASGTFNNQYFTPYGPPAPNSYVTPYANPPTGQNQQVMANPAVLQQAPAEPQHSMPDSAQDTEAQESSVPSPVERTGAELQNAVPQSPHATDKVKEKAKDQAPGPDDVIESTETEKDTAEEPKSTPETSKDEGDDGDDEYTQKQIDSFLALANVDSDSDSDEETDRDKTISREMTPVALPPGDPALESIVQGIISELTSNQNWGHGIGFLTPQTHLYQIHNAQRFAEGLRKYVNDAMPKVGCIISAEQGHAQSAMYEALVKRITNPYLDGTAAHYSNVVYHNGRAYQAIPGPAHPMYQQQLPYPPPPPPSSQLMMPAQGQHQTPLVDSARPASSSQPISTRATISMIRGYGNSQAAPQAKPSARVKRTARTKLKGKERAPTSSPALSVSSDSQGLPMRIPTKFRKLSVLHNYVSSESDHYPVILRKRKRGSAELEESAS